MEWRPVAPGAGTPITPSPGPGPVPTEAPSSDPAARKATGNIGWDIMFGVDLAFIAFNFIAGIVLYFQWLASGDDPNAALDGLSDSALQSLLFLSVAMNLVMFGVIPFAWVWGTRVGGWQGALRYLKMERPWPALAYGAPLAVGLVMLALVAVLVFEQLGWLGPTPNTETLSAGLNWPLAIFVSLVAGVTEEILFRGVIQRWIGVYGQAAVFGLFHLANGPAALVVTTLIGLVFGLLVKRGHSMWLVISAHVLYDLLLLAGALLFPELAEPPEALLRLW